MASTNKTTNFNLSQYVGGDKPTYLGDYNSDMSAIDSAMQENKVSAELAKTTADNAQSSAENAQETANTAVTNAAQAKTTADAVDTKVGDLADLGTITKSSVVDAINEVNENLTDVEDALNGIVINDMAGEETSKAPSVNSVKEYIGNHSYKFYTLSNTTVQVALNQAKDVPLNDVIENYDIILVDFYGDYNNFTNILKFKGQAGTAFAANVGTGGYHAYGYIDIPATGSKLIGHCYDTAGGWYLNIRAVYGIKFN